MCCFTTNTFIEAYISAMPINLMALRISKDPSQTDLVLNYQIYLKVVLHLICGNEYNKSNTVETDRKKIHC